jgi:hypothetical protein
LKADLRAEMAARWSVTLATVTVGRLRMTRLQLRPSRPELPTYGELDPIRLGGALVQQLLAIVKPEKDRLLMQRRGRLFSDNRIGGNRGHSVASGRRRAFHSDRA